MNYLRAILSHREELEPAMKVTRVEVRKGSVTQSQRHETECVVVVLQGAWCFRLPERTVTVSENQVLRIPPDEEHTAEALSDTVALAISSTPGDWSGCYRFLQDDPDQYLWGV